jgi:hypothetical protein
MSIWKILGIMYFHFRKMTFYFTYTQLEEFEKTVPSKAPPLPTELGQ